MDGVKAGNNLVVDKSKAFALRTIRLYQFLLKERREFVLSKQLVRSGTSIGANVREAIQGQSGKDFLAKMSIALKEAVESEYWLELLHEAEYLTDKEFGGVWADCNELVKLLTAIVKSTKDKI